MILLGSSDVWIPSKKCKTCAKHKSFNSDVSSTYKVVKDTLYNDVPKTQSFTISYGSGDIKGNVASDQFGLNTLLLPNTVFGEVTSEDETISLFDMDGIVGLGFNGLAVVTKPGILDSIKFNYPNLSLSFSMYLSSDPDDHTKPSKITFGDYDLNIVGENATFFYTPVVRYSKELTYWTVTMTGFEIGTSDLFVTANDVMVTLSMCTYGLAKIKDDDCIDMYYSLLNVLSNDFTFRNSISIHCVLTKCILTQLLNKITFFCSIIINLEQVV